PVKEHSGHGLFGLSSPARPRSSYGLECACESDVALTRVSPRSVGTMRQRAGMRPRTEVIDANGTKLYCEIVGKGPPALFIAGSTGDAGNFTRTAELLASEFTVVTYDRRGNSRSPSPAGWTTTSVSEQADDAARLIHALGLDPVCLFAA